MKSGIQLILRYIFYVIMYVCLYSLYINYISPYLIYWWAPHYLNVVIDLLSLFIVAPIIVVIVEEKLETRIISYYS